MNRETILYLSDKATCGDPVTAVLEKAGYEVVATRSVMQAIALLFILHPVASIVIQNLAGEQTSCEAVRSFRGIRRDVPIILLCSQQIGQLPSGVDAFVSTSLPLEKLVSTVRLLTANRSGRIAQNSALEALPRR